MVKVPTLTKSKVDLRPTAINSKTAATLGGEVVDLGEGISSLGEQMQKVQNITEKNNAVTALSKANDITHNKFQTDPNTYDAFGRADDELDKNVENAASNIHDPVAKEEFLAQAARMKDSKLTSINYMLQGRILQAGKTSLRNIANASQEEYNGAINSDQEDAIKKSFNNHVDEMLNTGAINPEAAENLREQQNYHFGFGKAINDIDRSNNPKVPQAVLDKLENGDYGDLKEQDYNHIKTRAEQKIQALDVRQKKAMLNIQERNARDLDLMLKTNNPNIQQHAEELFYTGQISQKTFDNYTGKGKKPLVDPNTDGTSYIEALAYIADPKTSIADARNFIMDKYNKNLIDPTDRDRLYDLAIRPYGKEYQSIKDVIGLEQTKKDETATFKHNLNSALDWIHNNAIPFGKHLPSFTDKSDKNNDKAVFMAKRFMKKISDNQVAPEDYIKTANDVVKEQNLIDRPEISGYPEEGQTEQDDSGVRSNTKPDGSTQDADESFGDKYGG